MKTNPYETNDKIWLSAAIGCALLLLATCPSRAEAQTNTFPPSGNAGIGTTSPTQALDVNGQVVTTGSQTLTVANKGAIEVTNTITNNAISVNAFRARNLFNGNGDFPAGLDVGPTFSPSANISLARGMVFGGRFAPPSGVTITDVMGGNAVTWYDNVSGAVTNGTTFSLSAPIVGGALKPTTQYGLRVANQGISGTTNSYGLYIDAQSGSTNNFAAIFAGGNVGIGTTTPLARLDVRTGTVALPPGGGLDPNVYHTWFPFSDGNNYIRGTTIIADQGGNVGIGTASPGSKLDVTGNVNASGTINAVGGLNINGSPVTSSQWSTSGSNINYATAGNVGIGTASPGSKLDVSGNINASGTINAVGGLNINGSPVTSSQWTTSGSSNINYATAGGNVGVGQSNPTYKLDVNGTAHVSGNMTVDGNLAAKYQDVAEWVPSSEQLPSGTVVVLDSTKSNQVISSTQAYDTRVAGVVSEQPGIALGEGGAGKVLVATTGRVLVNVDATKIPIHIGDLLVTSDVPGVAMKSEPVNVGGVQLHRPGTLIGKALEPLEKGSGKILVLLSLQ